MIYNFYSLKTMFNTHVGSGQTSYGIVDNIVQKDYLTGYPCINSTSLKGALREWVKVALKKETMTIFGDANETDKGIEKQGKMNKPGSHHFFQASLLSYPMRSDKIQFFNATCPEILISLKSQLIEFGIFDLNNDLDKLLGVLPKPKYPISLTNKSDFIVEAHNIKTVAQNIQLSDNLKVLFGDNLIIMHNDDFNLLIKKLPIITRNHLENGQSSNLFYEEIVPRETRFGFLVGSNKVDENNFSSIADESKLLQIGANATVGYGFCKLNKII